MRTPRPTNPSGPKTVPGTYRVRLTVDGKTQEQALKVVMDPRSPATNEVLTQQLQLGQQIFGETVEARRAQAEIASVQKQLADMQEKLAQQKLGAEGAQVKSALTEAQSGIDRILTNKEHAVNESPGLQAAYAGLASALRVVEGGDRAVPSQAIAVYKESSERVKAGIAEWSHFKQTRLEQLNQQLRHAKLAPITIAEIEQAGGISHLALTRGRISHLALTQ
jgi:hypothetical protein